MEFSLLLNFVATDTAQLRSKNAALTIGIAYDDGLVGDRSARKLTTEVRPSGREQVSNWTRFSHLYADVICEGNFISVTNGN